MKVVARYRSKSKISTGRLPGFRVRKETMNLKQTLAQELQDTQEKFLALLESIPEADYALPTDNPAWTVGDTLYHVTLGPRALALEIWMIVHARSVFQIGMKYFPSGLFNNINARFARRGKRVNRQMLIKAYQAGHTGIRSRLRRTREADMRKSVVYPAEFVRELAGEVSVERLFRYVKGHYDLHSSALRVARRPISLV
jgi:Mycothiol maleylpyruvate isomerase N-terminal domain